MAGARPRVGVRPAALNGALLMLGAMALLSAADGIAKELSQRYPLLEVVWARYAFNLLAVAPVLLRRHPPRELWSARPGLQAVRGAFLLGSTALYFAALALMPLADALTLTFVAPLIVAALSPWLLGERVGPRAYAAVAVGFAGTLLVARPGPGMLEAGAPLALAAGVGYAFFLITTRKLAGSAPPLVTLGWTAAVGTVATSVLLPFAWRTPGAADLLLMAGLGAGTALAHLLMIRAFAAVPAALLAPLTYLEIVGAVAVGYLAFGDFPDALTWIGAAVIVASGLFVSLGGQGVGSGHGRRARAEGP
jgi:drug/metabolite transporter (DMT)-like permease